MNGLTAHLEMTIPHPSGAWGLETLMVEILYCTERQITFGLGLNTDKNTD